MGREFQADCVDLAWRMHRAGRVGRRTLLQGLAALGFLVSARVSAQERTLVMVNWGGIANEAFQRFYGDPFMADRTGVTVVQDSSGPSAGRIKGMVESGKVVWDLCDSSASSSIVLGSQNLVNRIDYGIVSKADAIDPAFTLEHGAAPYSFSTLMAYDSAKFPEPPRSWADFWDLKKFPGTRLLRKDALAMLDAATLSLGADPAKLYPLPVADALKRIAEIRRNTIYWTSGSESEQAMRTGEAVMGMIWHTRAKVLEEESKGRIRFNWNQGFLQGGIWVMPRGNPGGELAQRLLASMLARTGPQVGLLKFLGNGPTNPKAAALVPPELRRFNPTDPDNARVQVVLNGVWWGQNYPQINQAYLDVITG